MLKQRDLSLMIGAHYNYINKLETNDINPGQQNAKIIVNVLNSKFVELKIPMKITTDDIMI